MATSVFKFNTYLFFKLPAAWWCGVRLKRITENTAEVSVTHRWINQNPFNSMFWAVQGMAAELATGVLIMQAAKASQNKISMLVINNKANFTKKAKGKLLFSCHPGDSIENTFANLVDTKKPQTLWLQARGVDEEGDVVSTFDFEWTLLLK